MNQTKFSAAGLSLIGHDKIRRLLRNMQQIGLLCKLKTGFSVHGYQRYIPVHPDAILRIQMQVELLDLPCAILSGKLGQISGVIGLFNAILHHVRTQLMRTVSVFTVHVVRDDNIRLVLSQQLGYKLASLSLLPLSVCILELAGI